MAEAATEERRRAPAPDARNRLAVALDMDDLVEAARMARELRPWFGVAKVGLELFSAAGPDAIIEMNDLGYRVFLDLKLHDIPTTVRKAARVIGAVGASYLTLHGAGGVPMLHAGVEGLADGAERAGLAPPIALAVTVLTSDETAPEHLLTGRVKAALESGCGGLVCGAPDLALVRELAPRLTKVVAGIRPKGAAANDQARTSTPEDAMAAGADLLVIGRAVTHDADPAAAAARVVGSLELERRREPGDAPASPR